MDFVSELRWRPVIGDPSFMGWLTVASYALGAVLAAVAAWSKAREQPAPGGDGREARLWLGVAMAMACLCVNKQLDLQSLLTDVGRVAARHQGWYEHRRAFQAWFVVGLIMASAAFCWWSLRRYTAFWTSHKALAAGLLFLLTFLLVRAISFHHVDAFLGTRVLGFKANWALELTGILLVGLAAARECAVRR